MPVRRRGPLVVSFLPQILRFPVDFGAGAPRRPNQRHAVATPPPQMCAAGQCGGHEELARIELSPVGWRACPVPELPMLSVYVPSESSLKKVAEADLAGLPDSAVWIDLVKPTAAEDKAVERLAGTAGPTRGDMHEIEMSHRR